MRSVTSLSFLPFSPPSVSHGLRPTGQEVDPLTQTPSLQESEELQLGDWSETRRGWDRRTPLTLLDALAKLGVTSVCSGAAEAGEGAADL